jgi:hypothetical protein
LSNLRYRLATCRAASNIKRALDGEFYFYSQVFGFTPAEEIEPVAIENL